MNFKKRVLSVAVLAILAGVSMPALAGDQVTDQDLLKLIKQQAAQIQQLKQRLSALEAHEHQAAPQSGTVATTASGADAAVATPVDSRRQAGLQALRQAQLSAGTNTGESAEWGKFGAAGPTFSSSDGFFTFRPRGRLMEDFSTTWGSKFPERNIGGSRLEAARLGAQGTVGPLGYRLAVDFRGGKSNLRQAYLSYSTSFFGHYKAKFSVGNLLKDIGVDSGSQSALVPFMLRNAAGTVGEPVNGYFGLGAQMRLYGTNWHYSLSVTGDTPGSSSSGDVSDSVAYVTRAHWNPIKNGSGFLHVGAWYAYEKIGGGVTKINDFPSIAVKFNGNLHVSASSISDPTQDHSSGYELGGVYRNFWVMSEYAKRTIDSSSTQSVHRHGSSLGAGWVITGEKPGLSTRSGTWRWVHVNRPVTTGGPGAFELVGRVDHYDFHGGAPRGGDGQSYTLGMNWYLNEWSRVMMNYIRWHTDNQVGSQKGSDWGNSLGMRLQLLF